MSKEKIEMSVELNGQEVVAYPYVNSDHVLLDNNMTIDKMLESDVVEPVITHEEVSFKVGQGDSDLSDSIVDSSAGGFTIKGQTYQNILPEPSTHVLSNNKEMFKVNEGLDPNVEIVDGVSKSAILKGNTLVNKITNPTNNSYEANTKIVFSWNSKFLNVYHCYNVTNWSREITVISTTGKPITVEWLTDNGSTVQWGGVVSSNIINKKLTLPSNCTSISISGLKSDGWSLDNVQQANVLVLDGHHTIENIPYFEGMQSVKMPVLTTTGKNLFDGELEKGTLSTSNGENIASSEYIRSVNFIPVEEKEKIIISNDMGYTWYFYAYDYNFNFIERFSINSNTPENCKYIKFRSGVSGQNSLDVKIQIEQGSVATSYEPYKSNILTVNEDVTLRGIGDVKDTLDCLTGEVTERIGEMILDGSEDWSGWFGSVNELTYGAILTIDGKGEGVFANDRLIDSKVLFGIDEVGIWNVTDSRIVIRVNKIEGVDSVSAVKSFLKNEPITIQYQLATPTIKTVDLSTSGNWEKIVLDGSENWESRNGGTKYSYTTTNIFDSEGADGFCDTFKFIARGSSNSQQEECVTSANTNNSLSLFTNNESLSSVGKLKTYLQSNPITVWYQTTTHQDSTQVKQPIFFKDGHIIQSSGADNSLIPTLDYQAKTSNSYVMDLMKTNTRYTMKAKSASGTFTIDGTSYGAGTNGTFTTPTSMTNKLLVMSNKTNEEVMILEGDVTDKTIPYFKGIKSAFEGEDKIEVLSTGKNLFNKKLSEYDYIGNYDKNEVIIGDNFIEWNASNTYKGAVYYHLYVKPNTSYTLSLERNIIQRSCITIYDGFVTSNVNNIGDMGANKNNISFVTLSNKITIRFSNGVILNETFKIYNVQLEEGDTVTSYESYKSNVSKIPLLSPLRSLPNGVCDELIVDRANNKAKIIQRVSEELMKLETPVITEVDLEGFPYVYKDGHIFLNSEIAPTTTIKYSINQAQVIQSQNSDIIRHSKEITNLHRLISEYVQVQYESTLLNLKVKMRA